MFGFAVVLNASAADAKANWDSLCAKCHGEDGKGQTKMGQKLGVKDFTDAKVQADLKDDAAFKAIHLQTEPLSSRTKKWAPRGRPRGRF